jgi:hypothetical protein
VGGEGGHGAPPFKAAMGGEDLVEQPAHVCAAPIVPPFFITAARVGRARAEAYDTDRHRRRNPAVIT